MKVWRGYKEGEDWIETNGQRGNAERGTRQAQGLRDVDQAAEVDAAVVEGDGERDVQDVVVQCSGCRG